MIRNDNPKQIIVFGESVSCNKSQVNTAKLPIPTEKDKILIGQTSLLKYNEQ